jgi:hypothetical protein
MATQASPFAQPRHDFLITRTAPDEASLWQTVTGKEGSA